jgi:hypothetical protein
MASVYVLKLEGGRYYVGKSDNVMKRYEEHLNGAGSSWTARYPPLSLIKTIEGVGPFEEDKTVKEYMGLYGIDKVRGGTYVTEKLTDAQRSVLNQEIWASQDRCTRCGSSGHWVATCRLSTAVPKITAAAGRCYRCDRIGHYASSCYARTDAEGYELEDESEEDDEDEDEDEDEEEEDEEDEDD